VSDKSHAKPKTPFWQGGNTEKRNPIGSKEIQADLWGWTQLRDPGIQGHEPG